MASNSFRDSINSLGWARRDDEPVNTSQQSGLLSSIQSLNPFGNGGYVRLPTTEGPGAPLPAPTRREEEEGWLARESNIPVLQLPRALLCPFPHRHRHTKAACTMCRLALRILRGQACRRDMCIALGVPWP
jgi:hypothetical protein